MIRTERRWRRAWLALWAGLLWLSAGARADWKPTDVQSEALEALNAIRAEMGLPLHRLDERLCAAATAHSAFVHQHRLSHDEKPDLAGFTGETPSKRAKAAGYPDWAGEAISYRLQSRGVTMAVRILADAPYHRGAWLQLNGGDIGVGAYMDVLTINYHAPYGEGTIVMPFDGQTDVPVSWSRGENPDPRDVWKLPETIGFPIAFQWETPYRDPMVFAGATLTDAKGVAVDVALNTPANDPALKSGYRVLIIPKRPLRALTEYTVRVSARSESGTDLSREWRFTTGDGTVPDMLDTETEKAMGIDVRATPGPGDGVTVRVLDRGRGRYRSFMVKARNGRGELLASTRLHVPPSQAASVVLKAKEPVFSVVLVPTGPGGGIPVTRVVKDAVRVRRR